MPSTIPYSPSLTLGSVIPPTVMDALTSISKAQAPIDAAQENLASLISLRRSLDMTRQELIDMHISPVELDASLVKVNEDIDAAASHYATVRMAQEETLLGLRTAMPPVMAGPESPVDFNFERTVIKQVPIGADSCLPLVGKRVRGTVSRLSTDRAIRAADGRGNRGRYRAGRPGARQGQWPAAMGG